MTILKPLMTFWKYIFWTAVAALIQAAIDNLTVLKIPDIYVPLMGAALKSLATWWASRKPK